MTSLDPLVNSLPQWLVRYGETIIITCNITFRWFQDTSTELLPLENLISVFESETASATRYVSDELVFWCVEFRIPVTLLLTSGRYWQAQWRPLLRLRVPGC